MVGEGVGVVGYVGGGGVVVGAEAFVVEVDLGREGLAGGWRGEEGLG